MKLGKDQIQKIVLSALLLVALLYGYFTFLLGPLAASETKAAAALKEAEPKVAEAKKQLQKTAGLERQAPTATAALEQLRAQIPDGEPIAWFPPRIAEFFKRQGIEKVTTRKVNEFAEKELPGFRRLVWAIDLPKVEFVPLGVAVAGLENEEPLLQVTNVSVEASKEEAQFQHVILTVATLVKQ